MTEERKIGGNRWTDFVKEYAQAHNVSYMCASTNPEVKAEWKNKKAAEKTPKAAKAPKAPKLTHEQVVEKALAKAKETVPSVPKVKGRPKKYATPEEAHRAKLEKTKISVQKKRAAQPKKRGQAKPLDEVEIKAYLAKSKEDLDQLETQIKAFLKDHPVTSLDEKDKKRIFHHIKVLDDKRRALGLIPPLGRGRKPKKTDDNITLTMTEVPNSVIPTSVHSVPTPSQPVSLTIADFVPKKRGRPKKAKVSAPVPTGFEGQGYANGEEDPMGETRPKRTGGMDPTFIPSFRPSPAEVGPWYLNFLFISFGSVAALISMSCGVMALASLCRALVQQFRGLRMRREIVPVEEDEPLEVPEVQLHDPIADWAREFNVPHAAVTLLRDHLAQAVRVYPINQVEDAALEAIQDVQEHPEEFFQLARNALPFAEEIHEATDVRTLRRNPLGEVFDPREIPSAPETALVPPVAPAEQEPDEPSGRGRKGGKSKKEDARVFKNYGKIQSHLAEHLDDLKEPIDPKDLRDFIYFTRERDRLKHKLVGGRGFFDKIGDAFKTTWNQKPQSKSESDALKFFYNDFLPVASAPINIIAPPVGKASDIWFNELKQHQLGQGRRRG